MENKDVYTKILLDTRKPLKTKANEPIKYAVKLRVTYKRQQKYYSVKGYAYSPDEFEEVCKDSNRGKRKKAREYLDMVKSRAREIIESFTDEFSFELFEKQYLKPKPKEANLQDYFQTKIEELRANGKFSTATTYLNTINSLKSFDSNVDFKKITKQFLTDYTKYMRNTKDEKSKDEVKREKPISFATIGIYLRNLRHIMNLAIKNKVITYYPFSNGKNDGYVIPTGKGIKKALNKPDLDILKNYQPKNYNEKIALQYWMFSYFCNGMNMADIANLRYKNIVNGEIHFIRQKTKDTCKGSPPIIVAYLVDEANTIINEIGNPDKSPDNYIFPIYNSSLNDEAKYKRIKQHIKTTNKYMRQIAKEIGLSEEITTYWARHTFSTVLKRANVSYEYISESLGHQSIQTTKSYLDTFETEHRKENTKHL